MIRFTTYPRTSPPPEFVHDVVAAFAAHSDQIDTRAFRNESPKSDEVLGLIRPDLEQLGFEVERGKKKDQKIHRPVFYGENGVPETGYQIDAFHPEYRCGIEVEAGRAWMGNAVYRDLILAMVMVDVDHLILAVPNEYWYKSGGRPISNPDYENTCGIAEALYAHDRVVMPYRLTVLGY